MWQENHKKFFGGNIMINKALKKIVKMENLNEKESFLIMEEIMKGEINDLLISAFLVGLSMKGETSEEISGFSKSMRENGVKINSSSYTIDTCGTGGDGGKTFNISTIVSIIAASSGIKVAKHGNRAISSSSGSADVLSSLGININLSPKDAEESIDKTNFAFLFAPNYHPAMKNIAPLRRVLGIRTVFNILGPITNPSYLNGQVLGIYNGDLTNTIAYVLLNLGRERALVVHGEDGLDEISTSSPTLVSEVKNGIVKNYKINPIDYGITLTNIDQIKGGSPEENKEIIINILKGEKGPKRDIVLLNSAAALYVGKKVENIKDGIDLASSLIDSGKSLKKLEEIINISFGA